MLLLVRGPESWGGDQFQEQDEKAKARERGAVCFVGRSTCAEMGAEDAEQGAAGWWEEEEERSEAAELRMALW